jgi:hypothetical protein
MCSRPKIGLPAIVWLFQVAVLVPRFEPDMCDAKMFFLAIRRAVPLPGG